VPSEQDLAAFADRRIRKLRRQVLAMAKIASADDPVALHRLRIGIKRLRYALEFFAPLVRGKSLHNAVHRLTGIQDALGQINDLANAGSLLTECAGEDARLREAVTLIAGWHAARYTALLDGVPRALKQLRDMKRLRLSSTRNRE
jgi:adenylate cyclase